VANDVTAVLNNVASDPNYDMDVADVAVDDAADELYVMKLSPTFASQPKSRLFHFKGRPF